MNRNLTFKWITEQLKIYRWFYLCWNLKYYHYAPKHQHCWRMSPFTELLTEMMWFVVPGMEVIDGISIPATELWKYMLPSPYLNVCFPSLLLYPEPSVLFLKCFYSWCGEVGWVSSKPWHLSLCFFTFFKENGFCLLLTLS